MFNVERFAERNAVRICLVAPVWTVYGVFSLERRRSRSGRAAGCFSNRTEIGLA